MSAHAPLARLALWEATTPIGESAAETALLLRAGVRNVTPSHFVDALGARVVSCRVPSLPPSLTGTGRLVALAVATLHRLAERMAPDGRVSVLVALPERLGREDASLDRSAEGEAFLAALVAELPPAWHGATVECFPFGRAGGALALRRAVALLAEGGSVVWGGVDSQHDWAVLQGLEQADRLLTLENQDGLRPGEAAAFALLSGPHAADDIAVLALGLAREPHPIGSETHSHTFGLRQALDAAVAPLRRTGQRCHQWWIDSTAEVYATQALQNVITHMSDVWGERTALHTPLKDLGDAGAATLPLMAALCAEGWRTGHVGDASAVLTGSSDRGARGALLLAVASKDSAP